MLSVAARNPKSDQHDAPRNCRQYIVYSIVAMCDASSRRLPGIPFMRRGFSDMFFCTRRACGDLVLYYALSMWQPRRRLRRALFYASCMQTHSFEFGGVRSVVVYARRCPVAKEAAARTSGRYKRIVCMQYKICGKNLISVVCIAHAPRPKCGVLLV